jgi:hypothetical protein
MGVNGPPLVPYNPPMFVPICPGAYIIMLLFGLFYIQVFILWQKLMCLVMQSHGRIYTNYFYSSRVTKESNISLATSSLNSWFFFH